MWCGNKKITNNKRGDAGSKEKERSSERRLVKSVGGGGENVYSLAHRADERQIPFSSHIGAKARIKVQTERERIAGEITL